MKNLLLFLIINISVFGQSNFFEVDSSKFIEVENAILKTNQINRKMLLVAGTIATVGLITDSPYLSLVSAPILLLPIIVGPSSAYYALGMKTEAFQRAFSRTFILGVTYYTSANILMELSGLISPDNSWDKKFSDLLVGIIGGGILTTFIYQELYESDIENLRDITYRKKSKVEIGFCPTYNIKKNTYGMNLQMRF